MTDDKKLNINVSIDHNEPVFYSDELTVSHTESKFILDFKQTTPRFDKIGNNLQQSLAIKHKTIVLDPLIAKSIMNAIKENIGMFEKSFGEIKTPKGDKSKKKKLAESVTDADGLKQATYIG